MTAPRKRLDIRIAAELREALDQQADQSGQMLTAIVERYIVDGMARDNGELVESSTLPAIRAAVREEVAKQFTELYSKLADDLNARLKRADNRLAAIGAKGARSAGIAWRLAFNVLLEQTTAQHAREVYEDAKAKAGKELAQREENIPGT
ncbi:MAG: hypothetical protein ACRDHW_00030 [Ktedonobacteraceae bacterium]